jgi:hypothetical protein
MYFIELVNLEILFFLKFFSLFSYLFLFSLRDSGNVIIFFFYNKGFTVREKNNYNNILSICVTNIY